MGLPDISHLKNWQKYGVALGLAMVAILLQRWFYWVGGDSFIFLLAAVLLSSRLCGLGAGLMTGLIGGAATLWWQPTSNAVQISSQGEAVALLLFLVTSILVAGACAATSGTHMRREDLLREVGGQDANATAVKPPNEVEHEFEAFFRAASVGIAIVDASSGEFLRVNPELCRLLACDERELLRRPYLDISTSEEHDRARSEFERLRRKDSKVMHWEGRCSTKSGETIWLECVGMDLPPNQAGQRRLIVVLIDISERRRAEDLVEAAERRKDEFLAMLSHELRNPLGAIRQALRLTDSEMDASTQQWAREVVDRQSAHLSRMVDDLLDVARFHAGKIKLVSVLLDLAGVIDLAAKDMQPLLAERGHNFETQYPRDLWVKGDAVRLEQMLVNLLTNAAKYTDWGGRIELHGRRDGEEVIVEVRDNGQGMAPERIAQMFEVFVQGERSLARPEGGLGLGLAIARQLAMMHGGQLRAQSAGPGKGSVFTVSLPASERPAQTAPLPGPTQTPRDLSKQRILVVDDHHDAARTLGRLLERRGAAVAVVHDGLSALHETTAFGPDAVLLDLGLPGCDGYEVARRIRGGGNADVKLIAVSGYGADQDRAESTAAGFNAHLVKPVDFEQLCGLLTAGAPADEGSSGGESGNLPRNRHEEGE